MKESVESRIVVVGMKLQRDAATEMDSNMKVVTLRSKQQSVEDFNVSSSEINSFIYPNNIEVSNSVVHTLDTETVNSSIYKKKNELVASRIYPLEILNNSSQVSELSKRSNESTEGIISKRIKLDPNVIVKDEPTEMEIDNPDLQDGCSNASVAVTNTDFLEVFDKAVGDVSTMFKKITDDPLNYVECTVCFKKIKESSMKQHFRTHAGLRPFPCDVCGTRFTRKSDVYRHKRVVHKKVKPYVCKMCGKTFPHRNLLLVHLQNHDNHVSYECDTCGYKFGKKEYYDSHTRFIHPTNGSPKTIINREEIVEDQLRELEEEDEILHGAVDRNAYKMNSRISKISIDNTEDMSNDGDTIDGIEEEDLDDVPCPDMYTSDKSECEQTPASVKLHSVSRSDGRNEDLVHKILEAAVKQSTSTLHGLAAAAAQQRGRQHKMEVILRASLSGQLRRFHIQLCMQQPLNLLSEPGMELIFAMVNQLCVGKGDLDGPIEVELHKPSSNANNSGAVDPQTQSSDAT